MLTEADLAAYVQRVRYQWIDVDKVFGAQCWDQWSHYATNFLGVPSWPTYTNAGGTGPHAGWACNVWHHFDRSGLGQWFEKIPAGQPFRPGDVVIWELGSVWYPLSHIATLLEVLANGMLRCLTQNPGAVQIADLIPRGVLGALRPKALTVGAFHTSKTPALAASQKAAALARARRRKDDPMHLIVLTTGARQDGSPAYAIYRPGVKGSWEEYDKNGARKQYANALASQFGQPMEVTVERWLELKEKYA
ncbi:hypothetical protein Leucomu_13555 [Leucobacter muris]|uniref:CHAP domain-containing protein n=1 Tax=Leucobacter muris TaxID=1935379 RepID=A0ABX5QI66_9MICO|nr:hypothetical protein [Leucobacter muris]QAB18799.1 hypothetical protein Leucomu_13555 [Leucobacter muris]